MIKDFIASEIRKEIKFTPTTEQNVLIDKLSGFITNNENNQIFLLKGFAGTGKTTTMSAFVNVLHKLQLKTILLAPTGRAAKVFSFYTGKSAFTVHKEIYIQKSSSDGFGSFTLSKNLKRNTCFIVDEASMISNSTSEPTVFGNGRLLDDLIEYVYSGKNCKLILAGDTAQLPPVGINLSPALDSKTLQTYNLKVIEVYLKEVVRQSSDSGILANATIIRTSIDNNEIQQPEFTLSGYNDIVKLGGADLIETISDSFKKYGIDETIVVCRSNKRANRFNAGIRSQILGREEEVSAGDLLMVVKNNYFWLTENEQISFIANGDIIRLKRIKKIIERYGFHFAETTVEFIDYAGIEIDVMILLDTLQVESASLGTEENKKLFLAVAEDYTDQPTKKKQWQKVKENPFFNALQVKFAYALTCHKAQGGQWKSVFADQGYVTKEMINIEYLRWLYTALTRAVNILYLVNFNKEFFLDAE